MQVFFVIDSVKDIEEKIELIENSFNSDIRFFVKTDLYTSVCTNKKILEKLVGVYDNNETKKIDEYIKSSKYEADNVILYYSSAKITEEMIKVVIKKAKYGYDVIYFKKYKNKFLSLFEKFYMKICKFMFGVEDSLCYRKFQYISKNYMKFLIDSRFNNHIIKTDNFSKIELEEADVIQSMKEKIKFKTYHLWNIILFLLLISAYVICEVFFNLRFYMYLGFILFSLLFVFIGIMLVVHNIFEERYKRK